MHARAGAEGDTLLHALETQLVAQGTSSETIIQIEYQLQSGDDVSVRNIITSMKFVSNLDWAEFFEDVSLVDEILSEGTNFKELDFATRDSYRGAVEQLARRTQFDELQIAKLAAVETKSASRNARERDLGYCLIDKGRRVLEIRAGYRPSVQARLTRLAAKTGAWGYIAATVSLAAVLLTILLLYMRYFEVFGASLLGLAILGLIPSSDLATALVNRTITNRWRPKVLPAMALKGGVGPEFNTVLAVPILLGDQQQSAEQVERLEVHYLSNEDANLQLALLSDWMDSSTEVSAEDESRLKSARDQIAELNQRHANGEPRFFILHRKRLWNSAQAKWMGWERKRGKLYEFNQLFTRRHRHKFYKWSRYCRLSQEYPLCHHTGR